jgi:hypothetical protein
VAKAVNGLGRCRECAATCWQVTSGRYSVCNPARERPEDAALSITLARSCREGAWVARVVEGTLRAPLAILQTKVSGGAAAAGDTIAGCVKGVADAKGAAAVAAARKISTPKLHDAQDESCCLPPEGACSFVPAGASEILPPRAEAGSVAWSNSQAVLRAAVEVEGPEGVSLPMLWKVSMSMVAGPGMSAASRTLREGEAEEAEEGCCCVGGKRPARKRLPLGRSTSIKLATVDPSFPAPC